MTVRLLAALVAGLGLGALLPSLHLAAQSQIVTVAGAVGGLWLDALRMTIVPLVFSLLVAGIGRLGGTGQAGGFTARVFAMFVAFVLTSTVISFMAVTSLLRFWPSPPAAAAALRAASRGTTDAIPHGLPLAQLLHTLVPANAIKGAAEGNMLSVVMFGFLFGLAATRLAASRRGSLFDFFEAVQATMMTIVSWVLWLGAVGIFFLALAVGAKTGFSAVGVLGHYVLVISLMCLLTGVFGLVVGVTASKISPARVAEALAQPTTVAISTQSSLACLPAMLRATERIGVPEGIRNLVLPLAVALFRIATPAANIAVAVYAAHIYGVTLEPTRIVAAILVTSVVSLAAVGVSSTTTFFANIVPICVTLGAPIEILPLLLAVETFPDFSRTVGNVLGDVGVAALAGRFGQIDTDQATKRAPAVAA